MYLRAVIFASITFIITVIIEVIECNKKKFNFIKAFIGVFISLVFLTYPLFDEYLGIARIACTVLFAIQAFSLNQDFGLVGTIASSTNIGNLYIFITYILYLVAPLLSASALISIFSNLFSKFKLKINFKKEIHIFSEINEKTINLANRIIETNKNAKIIFTNKGDKENLIVDKHFIKVKEKINELNLYKIKKEKNIYFMSNNEDDNLNECLEFLDKAKIDEQANIYVLNDKTEAYMIIDSVMSKYYDDIDKLNSNAKASIRVETINETESVVLNRLKDLPIKNIFKKEKNQVTVLIVGCGQFGQAFLKNIAWCFQVVGYILKIIVVDKNSADIIDKINLESPELLKKYDISFINQSIETVIFEDLLKDNDIDYAIVTAGTDTNNFNIAISLRRYFLVNNKDNVLIDMAIRNTYKSKNIAILKNENNKEYNINTFGNIKNIYYENPIINPEVEEMARAVHSINWSDDKNFREYNKLEYNRKSSKAVVVHIKYKLYSILLDKYTGDLQTDIENYKKLISDKKIITALAENEHNRWMAYMYADGYKTPSIEQVKKYYLKTGSHKDTLAKLHPALVENKDIQKVQNDINNLIKNFTANAKEKNFVKLDYEIVQSIDKIVGKKY